MWPLLFLSFAVLSTLAFCFIICLFDLCSHFPFHKLFPCILNIFHCIWLVFQHLSFLSAVDPDPDPTFEVNLVPDTEFWWPKIWKNRAENYLKIFDKNLQFTCPYRTSKLQEKPWALNIESPTLKKMNVLIFSISVGHFFPPGSVSGSGLRILIQGPHLIRIHSGSGSKTLFST